jgi:hypothetical protein
MVCDNSKRDTNPSNSHEVLKTYNNVIKDITLFAENCLLKKN